MKDERLRGISCFSGIGGLDLALQEDVRTVCYIEWDSYCQEVLKKRMQEGLIDDAPIWPDIRSFNSKEWAGRVDIVFGGFPCQDISEAGKREGIKKGNRSGLWYEMLTTIGFIRPPFIFLENVSVITRRGLCTVIGGLAEEGYSCRWTTIRASDVGAPHRRERWFCLAYNHLYGQYGCESFPQRHERQTLGQYGKCVNRNTNGDRKDKKPKIQGESSSSASRVSLPADNSSERRKGKLQRPIQELPDFSWCEDVRRVEDFFQRPHIPKPLIWGVDNGVPKRMDRLKCLGNAVVPQQGRRAWRMLTNQEGKT